MDVVCENRTLSCFADAGFPCLADNGTHIHGFASADENGCLTNLKCEDCAMKKAFAFMALLLILVLSAQVFGQSGNASLSGIVTDSSGGIVPGVVVTATNTATGVENAATSNNAGLYSFPSLLPGTYKVNAMKTGFQAQTFTDVRLGNAGQVRLNFKLEVAGVATAVEVSIAADRLLLESSSSAGEVLGERVVKELPLVNNNALDLVKIASAYIPTGNYINGANEATIAGVSIANLNIQRDGVDVSDVRFPAGIHAPTQINPDLVGEFRLITAPVDAEMGRGNSSPNEIGNECLSRQRRLGCSELGFGYQSMGL
jgi:hypothetical protein